MPLFSRNVRRRINAKICSYVFCILLPLLLSPLAVSEHKELRCAYVILLMVAYWVLEPMSVCATGLLPVVLFPLLGVLNSSEVCSNYMKEVYMMAIGAMIVAFSVEESKLHERISLKMLLLLGTEIKWLMLSLMLITSFLSLWMRNLSTVIMIIPIVDAIISQILQSEEENKKMVGEGDTLMKKKGAEEVEVKAGINAKQKDSASKIKTILLLSVCYSANIGGTGSLIGNTPNILLKAFMDDVYPESDDITFASWMIYSVPGMFLCIFIGWLYLWFIYLRFFNHNAYSKRKIHAMVLKRYTELGSFSIYEFQVLILFLLLAFLWISRESKYFKGWVDIIGSDTKIGNSVPSIGIALFMFLFPANPKDIGGRRILDWKTAQSKIPWGIFLLRGGGMSLADASQKSGLSHLLGTKFSALSIFSPAVVVVIMCFMTAMITETMRNTTTATILLPVLSQMATTMAVNPLYLIVPVIVSCSFAFMLPAATSTNALVYEYGNMKMIDMVKPGIAMNIICCAIQLLMINTLGVSMFGLNTIPSWANKTELSTSSAAARLL